MPAHNALRDDWHRAHGGFRGSHLLLAGAVALGLGALVSTAGDEPRSFAAQAGRASGVLGLFLVGLAFAWTCVVGILHRFGLVVAILCGIHGGCGVIALYGLAQPGPDPAAVAVSRTAALVAFTLLARRALGRPLTTTLASLAGAACLGAAAPVLAPGFTLPAIVGATLRFGLAVALGLLAQRLRRLEDDWARRNRGDRRTDFSEFNNPQHRWNRPDGRTGLSCARLVS